MYIVEAAAVTSAYISNAVTRLRSTHTHTRDYIDPSSLFLKHTDIPADKLTDTHYSSMREREREKMKHSHTVKQSNTDAICFYLVNPMAFFLL